MKITSFFSTFFTTEYTEYHGVFFLVLIIQIEANNDKTIGLRGNRIPPIHDTHDTYDTCFLNFIYIICILHINIYFSKYTYIVYML